MRKFPWGVLPPGLRQTNALRWATSECGMVDAARREPQRAQPSGGTSSWSSGMVELKRSLTSVFIAAAVMTGSGVVASANHVRIDAPAVPSVLTPPTVPTPAQTLQAEEIKADVVRANVIYANKLQADQVRGTVYQGRQVKVSDSRGRIRAPEVVASVIYADEISANTVVADQVYVRELDRR